MLQAIGHSPASRKEGMMYEVGGFGISLCKAPLSLCSSRQGKQFEKLENTQQ